MLKFSIIIPYYNADKWIGRCLDSLLSQDLPHNEYEIIVVDDGSASDAKVLKEYVQKYPIVRYIRQDNSGPGAARNTGLKNAKGEYVLFCDSDDFVAENVFKNLYTIAHEQSVDMLFYKMVRVYEGAQITLRDQSNSVTYYTSGQEYMTTLTGRITSGVWQFMIRKEYVYCRGIQFPSWIMNEDTSFYLDAVLQAGRVATVDSDVYYYVQNPTSLIHSSGRKKQTLRYAENMYLCITKLETLITDIILTKNMPLGCKNNLIGMRDGRTYTLLHTLFIHGYVSETKSYLQQLKKIGAYPFGIAGKRHVFLKRIMNIEWLWIALSRCVVFLPQGVRNRFDPFAKMFN